MTTKKLLEMNYRKLYLKKTMILKAVNEKPQLHLACADTTAIQGRAQGVVAPAVTSNALSSP